MNQIPSETSFNIFQYLKFKDLYNIRRTCKSLKYCVDEYFENNIVSYIVLNSSKFNEILDFVKRAWNRPIRFLFTGSNSMIYSMNGQITFFCDLLEDYHRYRTKNTFAIEVERIENVVPNERIILLVTKDSLIIESLNSGSRQTYQMNIIEHDSIIEQLSKENNYCISDSQKKLFSELLFKHFDSDRISKVYLLIINNAKLNIHLLTITGKLIYGEVIDIKKSEIIKSQTIKKYFDKNLFSKLFCPEIMNGMLMINDEYICFTGTNRMSVLLYPEPIINS